MLESMGMAAGELWQFLNTNGQSSVAKVMKESELDTKSLQRAIGWLAKEDKLLVTTKGRTELLSLK